MGLKIEAVGRKPKDTAQSLTLLSEDKKKPEGQVAYMGPNIGNLLNGSQKPTDASAVRA